MVAKFRLLTADADTQKRAAAARAVLHIQSDTVIGLGTGSTVRPLLALLAERIAAGELENVLAVPTSEDTAARCGVLGIALTTLNQHPKLALAIDGADEVGPHLALIKGLGGALLHEKLVALAAKTLIIIADASKRVRRLGTRSPVPVEVIPFGYKTHQSFFTSLGAEPLLRHTPEGEPYRTDGGHFIVDCRFPKGIADPEALARKLDRRTGIVDHGLFLGMADRAIIAGPAGVREITA